MYQAVIHSTLYEPSGLLFDKINQLSDSFKSDSNRRQFAHVFKTLVEKVC